MASIDLLNKVYARALTSASTTEDSQDAQRWMDVAEKVLRLIDRFENGVSSYSRVSKADPLEEVG